MLSTIAMCIICWLVKVNQHQQYVDLYILVIPQVVFKHSIFFESKVL